MNSVYDFLILAFKSGVNSGITEAAHHVNCLMDKKPGTFEDFIKLIEPLLTVSVDDLKNLNI